MRYTCFVAGPLSTQVSSWEDVMGEGLLSSIRNHRTQSPVQFGKVVAPF